MVAVRGSHKSAPSRYSQTRALLGEEQFSRVRSCKVLVVGAGGIGCELLKNLVLVGFGNIEILDLDTIDLSNLNRQFLFRKSDIKKSKALVAAAFAGHFNPLATAGPNGTAGGTISGAAHDTVERERKGVRIHARHGNIKEKENDVAWLKGFDLVMSALDNREARQHVNKMCCAAGVPLIESGTQGYLGQVTPIMKDRTECYDCIVKPVVKTFPVCTIRATPSEPIHCIVWGKSYLFGKLFGEDDEATDETELEKAKADGENADEIDNLKKEAAAFREVRKTMGDDNAGPLRVFEKVFKEDIERLLSMEDMWKVPGRVKPTPLDHVKIMDGTFEALPVKSAGNTSAAATANGQSNSEHRVGNGSNGNAHASGSGSGNDTVLKDQRELSLKDNLELFIDSCKRLSARAIAHPNVELSFDKDDDDTLDFVLATANLRATAYGIPTKTRFEVKQMAGNIIPAIATTNAIMAGFIVMRALNILANDWTSCKNVYLKAEASKSLGSFAVQPPEPTCGVCRDTYVSLECDVHKLTLGAFVGEVVRSWLGWTEDEDGEDMDVAIYEGTRLLADSDFDDNYAKTLGELGIERGKTITVADEAEKYWNVQFAVGSLREPQGEKLYHITDPVPTVPRRPAPPPKAESPPPQIVGQKRSAPDDADDPDLPASKRAKVKDEQGEKGEKPEAAMVVDSDEEFEIL